MANLSEDNIREVLWVYRDRLVDLKKDPRLVYGMVFKNVGAAAGASLEHSHSQLIVTPIVPINVWEEMTGSLEFFNYRGRCIYCDMIHQELATEKRIVLDTPNFVSFCPVRQPFPVRDVDPAQEPQQPLREHPEERGGGAGHGAEDDPAEAGDRRWTSRRTTTSSTRRRSTRRRCRTITGTSRSSRG